MTDTLTARLAAIGVTLPEVEEYNNVAHSDGFMLATHPPYTWKEFRDLAEAALAAVVGELERVVAFSGASFNAGVDWKQRAEQAEAENARKDAIVADLKRIVGKQEQELAEAEHKLRDLAFYLDGIGEDYCRSSVAAVIKQIVGAEVER